MIAYIFRKYSFIFLSLMLFTNTSCTQEMTDSGLITKTSTLDFETTYSKLKMIIDTNPNLTILFELDHSKNATKADLALRPTRILFFGNPKLGTPLMNASETTGIDLPQKILVFQDEDGTTKISYNDPVYLKNRHQLKGVDAILEKVSGALHKITEAATH